MLRRNMQNSTSLRLGLDDLLADLQHARRWGELGRLALIAYCDVRCWARQAGEFGLAERSTAMFTKDSHTSQAAFLEQVDQLIGDLQQTRARFTEPGSPFIPCGPQHDGFGSAAPAV